MTARYFTDEDVFAAVAPALRKLGIDAVSTPEVGRLGKSDESQHVWATSENRVLVTFIVAHFAELHGHWMSLGQTHAEIVASSQRPIGDLLRRIVKLAGTLDAASLIDRLEYLGNW